MGMTATLKFKEIVEKPEVTLAIELTYAAEGVEHRKPQKPGVKVSET
jgi:histidine ammonia-lyase